MVVSYIDWWFSSRPCSTTTIIPNGSVLPLSSCIAPDVIALARCPVCDGQATQIAAFKAVALISTIVEAYMW